MKSSPVLFSAPMVRAILEGRKTQTRRVVKPTPSTDTTEILQDEGTDWREWFPHAGNMIPKSWKIKCPYGKPGGQLWVKETWRTQYANDTQKPIDITEGEPVRYEADECENGNPLYGWGRIRQSIFMRRWMSRITLEITSIRVERLQDISEADAMAEGANPTPNPKFPKLAAGQHVRGYKHLWDSINGPGSWEANPFVWVIEFKRI